jgi:predicted oxidoreductase
MAGWGFDTERTLAWIEACLGLGITTFDHADLYGKFTCEAQFGAALARKSSLRAQLQIVTKCGIRPHGSGTPPARVKHYDSSAAYVQASVDRSLAALQCEVIDVLLLHRPDPLMDADALAHTFNALHAAGKVRYFGVSNHNPAQIDLLQSRCTAPLVTNQIELSLRQIQAFTDSSLDHAQQHRMRPMAWSPLAGGQLLREDFLSHLLREMTQELGLQTPEQTALAWLMAHPAGIVPVLGSREPQRLAQAVAATQVRMGREDWFRLWSAALGREVP